MSCKDELLAEPRTFVSSVTFYCEGDGDCDLVSRSILVPVDSAPAPAVGDAIVVNGRDSRVTCVTAPSHKLTPLEVRNAKTNARRKVDSRAVGALRYTIEFCYT